MPPKKEAANKVFKKYKVKDKISPACRPIKRARKTHGTCLVCYLKFKIKPGGSEWCCPKCNSAKKDDSGLKPHKIHLPSGVTVQDYEEG